MKKIKLLTTLVLLSIMSINLTSCSGNNNDEPSSSSTSMCNAVAGTYKGTITQTHYYTNSTSSDTFTGMLKIIIDNNSQSYVTISYYGYIYDGTWSDITTEFKSELYSVSSVSNGYELKGTSSGTIISITKSGQLSVTVVDTRNEKGIGLVEIFEGTISK